MKSRIYRVTEIATNKVRIIEATSVAHAMKHVAETTHKCEVAGGVEAVKLIAEGVKFESAVKNVDFMALAPVVVESVYYAS